MYTSHSKQQPLHYRKRKCIVYKPNDFFEAFDFSQQEIIQSFQQSSQCIMIKSLAILVDNIRNASVIQKNQPQSPKRQKNSVKESIQTFKKSNFTFKKEISKQSCEQQSSTIPEKQMKQFVQYEKTGKKSQKSNRKLEYCIEEKKEQPNYSVAKKYQKIMNSLEKLSVQQNFDELEKQIANVSESRSSQNSEDTNLLHFEQEEMLRQKTVSELISESNAKRKISQIRNYSPIQSENQQYEMTDHSSNESSNEEGDYDERFAYQTDKTPMFGTIFSKGLKNMFSESSDCIQKNKFSNNSVFHPPQKLNIKPLLDSPKKQNTKKKRLYINKKKVPCWAENLQEVAKLFGQKEQKRLRSDPYGIFGICIIQHMQTNTIFGRKDEYKRSSTAKWQRQKRFFV